MMHQYSYRDLIRDLREGPFTSIGCYPKFFVTADGSVLSYQAVRSEWRQYVIATLENELHARRDVIIGADINWEDGDLFCDETNERIPSAYAGDFVLGE